MLPLLTYLGDGAEHSLRETVESLAEEFGLSNEERRALLPSGLQRTFDNRVSWARTYMKKAGLIESTRRGYFKITKQGLEVLREKPGDMNITFLKRFPEFVEWQAVKKAQGKTTEDDLADGGQTPEEDIEAAFERVRRETATELLQTVKDQSPAFFERLVIDLLLKMGYGGTRHDAGQAIGRSGDGGIDGIIKEDRLGLDIVYIQAKRWDGPIGRPEIQKFAGALQGQRARKGVFITTSSFSQTAHDYVSRIDSKIVLIDGDSLAQLMLDYNVGVTTVATYELKRIDTDYFEEQ